MKKLKEKYQNIIIENFADFYGSNLNLNNVIKYIRNLNLDELKIDEFNDLKINHDETIRIFAYEDIYERLKINIDEIF